MGPLGNYATNLLWHPLSLGTTDEDTDFSGSLVGSDADGDALTYAIASNPNNGQ